MEYHGKLFGHLGGKRYFDTGRTSDDWDALEKRVAQLEAENKELRQSVIVGTLPSHIETGQEAKKYAENMNSKGDFSGFHEIDFYNGTEWLRQRIEGNDANRLLPALQRPKMASEALKLLKDGIQVEMETGKVFDFMRYVEKAESNFRFRCCVNEFTEGYTVLKHTR